MIANYGYKDASGDYFISIDTDRCDGCGDCVNACPADIFEVLEEDPYDPLREEPVCGIVSGKKNNLKYECIRCKPATERPPLPCVEACNKNAISHSW